MNNKLAHLVTILLVTGYAAKAHALVAPSAVPVFDAWGLAGLSIAVAAAAFFVRKRKK